MTAGVASIFRRMIGSFCAEIKEKGIKREEVSIRISLEKRFVEIDFRNFEL